MEKSNSDLEHEQSRRTFLKILAASGAVSTVLTTLGCGAAVSPPTAATTGGDTDFPSGPIPQRPLGKTGVKVSMVGLGGFHIGSQSDEKESIQIIRAAIDHGINFMDNCWDYNKGRSEIRMGKALRDGYRDKVFLMTKIDGRTRQTAEAQLAESLQRLQTDHLDLLQFHEVIRDTDPDRIFAPGGAMEVVLEARKQGKIRFIGFTGHKSPSIHLKMLKVADEHNFRFDTVQMPLNVMDAQHDSFEKNVLPVLVEKEIGVLGMKSMGDGFILKSKTVEPMDCLHYAMNLPTSVVITGCDSIPILKQALTAAQSFKPLTPDDVKTLLAKANPASKEGEYEKYKTSDHFDSTSKNPEWLG